MEKHTTNTNKQAIQSSHDEVIKHYSTVTRLIHYASKFTVYDDPSCSKLPFSMKYYQWYSTSNQNERSTENRRIRLAPLWPEWKEAAINAEPWDGSTAKRKDHTTIRTRLDIKQPTATTATIFEDPEGKVELPAKFRVAQWKRPIEYLPPEKPPVIVDPDSGIHTFDLISSNEHLHQDETMRHIISHIMVLWHICRRQMPTIENTIENVPETNLPEHTWRPWEHIYSLTKVQKQPFIPQYNPAGKYVVRLYFLGCWRKLIVDDTIPFDDKNMCLLPQTSLNHELWPMLLTKALLKIIFLDVNSTTRRSENQETIVIHALTGWIPELIPVKYGHGEKIWNFLRHDTSNKLPSERDKFGSGSSPLVPIYQHEKNQTGKTENILQPKTNEDIDKGNQVDFDRINSIRLDCSNQLLSNQASGLPRAMPLKDKRSLANHTKENRKFAVMGDPIAEEDANIVSDDQNNPEAPKLIVFGSLSNVHSDRSSIFTETANQSERLRKYSINETFAVPMLLTSIRDVPLELPVPEPEVPAWKLIRPRKPVLLPHAEPIGNLRVLCEYVRTCLAEEIPKQDRWIELSSPYINYPSAHALKINPTTRYSSPEKVTTSINLAIPGKHVVYPHSRNVLNTHAETGIPEIDDDDVTKVPVLEQKGSVGLTENGGNRTQNEFQDKIDEMVISKARLKRDWSTEKRKTPRRLISIDRKYSTGSPSVKSQILGNRSNSTIVEVPVKPPIKPYVMPKTWMTFDDFTTCFTSIIIFHNPLAYQYVLKNLDSKLATYQQSASNVPSSEKRKEHISASASPIPIAQDENLALFLFVDTNRKNIDKNINLIISLTNLSRWYEAPAPELPLFRSLSREKISRNEPSPIDRSLMEAGSIKTFGSQKDLALQAGSLVVERYSWKVLSIREPLLRLNTTVTKGALLSLPPGRHVLKITHSCPLATNLQIMSDTHDFTIGEEDFIMRKVCSTPEDLKYQLCAEELFDALNHSVDTFHSIDSRQNRLQELFTFYSNRTTQSLNLNVEICTNIFNHALYSTLREIFNETGSQVTSAIQYAWRCFTNDMITPDILEAFNGRRPSTAVLARPSGRMASGTSAATSTVSTKKSTAVKDKTNDEKSHKKSSSTSFSNLNDSNHDIETRKWTQAEIKAIEHVQRIARHFLKRRMELARTIGTEKNRSIQTILQSSMESLNKNRERSARLLFKNFLMVRPRLIECFDFAADDWNMVSYRDYQGSYQETQNNSWFILCREIFRIAKDCFLAVKFISHLPNSLLRIINNDTYEEIPLVFNRLVPSLLTRNKRGYTFVAEGMSLAHGITQGNYRIRLITSYSPLPTCQNDQINSSFIIRETKDYYVPNKEQIICRQFVRFTDDVQLTKRPYLLASIQFSVSYKDALIRLSILDNNETIVSVQGKGSVVIPAFLFWHNLNVAMRTPLPSSSPVKSQPSGRTRDSNVVRRKSIVDSLGSSNNREKERVRSGRSRSETREDENLFDDHGKSHSYVIEATLLYQSWPLTRTQWQFVELLREKEKNELLVFNRQPSPFKTEEALSGKQSGRNSGSAQMARTRTMNSTQTTGRTSESSSGKSSASRTTVAKSFDMSKAHWTMRIVNSTEKGDELILKKDNEKNDHLMNTKKQWEVFEPGRAQKATETRRRFLDSLLVKDRNQTVDDLPELANDQVNSPTVENLAETKKSPTTSDIQESPVVIPPHSSNTERVSSSGVSKKKATRDQAAKQSEVIAIPLNPVIIEPFLNESPFVQPKIQLPPLDLQPFIKCKLGSDGPIDFEDEYQNEMLDQLRREFLEFSEYTEEQNNERELDAQARQIEKIRQLTQCIELQAKIDQSRLAINQPREELRQRYLEIERRRRAELLEKEKQIIEVEKLKPSTNSPPKKRRPMGKKRQI